MSVSIHKMDHSIECVYENTWAAAGSVDTDLSF